MKMSNLLHLVLCSSTCLVVAMSTDPKWTFVGFDYQFVRKWTVKALVIWGVSMTPPVLSW